LHAMSHGMLHPADLFGAGIRLSKSTAEMQNGKCTRREGA